MAFTFVPTWTNDLKQINLWLCYCPSVQKKSQLLSSTDQTLDNSKFEFRNLHCIMSPLLVTWEKAIGIQICNPANVRPWFHPRVMKNSFFMALHVPLLLLPHL